MKSVCVCERDEQSEKEVGMLAGMLFVDDGDRFQATTRTLAE